MKSENTYKPGIAPGIGALLFVGVLWLGNLYLLKDYSETARGTFGDMFGVVNALFSGLAFAGVIYAVALQRHEIAVTRKEIEYTKEILDKQQDHISDQNKLSERQTFESTFFQMLGHLTTIVDGIDLYSAQHGATKGKDMFPVFRRRMESKWVNNQAPSISAINTWYNHFYQDSRNEIAHYFRTISVIMWFVHISAPSMKALYMNMLRDQMSDDESITFFYYCYSENGKSHILKLALDYNFFVNVDRNALLDDDAKQTLDRAFAHLHPKPSPAIAEQLLRL